MKKKWWDCKVENTPTVLVADLRKNAVDGMLEISSWVSGITVLQRCVRIGKVYDYPIHCILHTPAPHCQSLSWRTCSSLHFHALLDSSGNLEHPWFQWLKVGQWHRYVSCSGCVVYTILSQISEVWSNHWSRRWSYIRDVIARTLNQARRLRVPCSYWTEKT